MADDAQTTVVRMDWVPCRDGLYIVGDARLSPAHAVRVSSNGPQWRDARDVGDREECAPRTKLYRIQTSSYCEDTVVTRDGVALETWDGRSAEDWRPHYYDASGIRRRCGFVWASAAWAADVVRERYERARLT